MIDEHEDQIMQAATAIMRVVGGLPLDLAISSLMVVVADLIRSSREPALLWAALAYGIEINSRLQHRVVSAAPKRLQ